MALGMSSWASPVGNGATHQKLNPLLHQANIWRKFSFLHMLSLPEASLHSDTDISTSKLLQLWENGFRAELKSFSAPFTYTGHLSKVKRGAGARFPPLPGFGLLECELYTGICYLCYQPTPCPAGVTGEGRKGGMEVPIAEKP